MMMMTLTITININTTLIWHLTVTCYLYYYTLRQLSLFEVRAQTWREVTWVDSRFHSLLELGFDSYFFDYIVLWNVY